MAKEMRKSTGDERYYAQMETVSMTYSERLEAIIARPFKILFQEPILIAITVYMSVRNLTCPVFVSSLTPLSSSSTAVFICCSRRIR